MLEFLAHKLGLISKEEIDDHKKYYSPEDIRSVLVKSGFKDEDIKVGHFQFGLNTLCVVDKSGPIPAKVIKNKWLRKIFDNRVFVVTFGLLNAIYLSWWLAFYPAILSYDSLSQWTDAVHFSFSNWAPYTYALIMHYTALFTHDPSGMALFQILLFSSISAWAINYSWKSGVSKGSLWVILMLLSGLPVIGIYNVTIWKDVPFSVCITAALFILSALIIKNRLNRGMLIMLVMTVLLASLVRHGGLIIISLFFLPIFAFFWKEKGVLLTYLFFLLLGYFFMTNLLPSYLKVREFPVLNDTIFVKIVGSAYNYNDSIVSPSQERVFSRFMVSEKWKETYDCRSVNALFFDNYILSSELDMKAGGIFYSQSLAKSWKRESLLLAIRHPRLVVADKYCQAKSLFGFVGSPYKYQPNIAVLDQYVANNNALEFVAPNSKLPNIKKILINYLNWTTDSFVRSLIFWSIVPSLLVEAFLLGFALMYKYRGTITYIVISNLYLLVILLTAPASDFRYVYPYYLSSIFLILIYQIEKKHSSKAA